MIKGATEFIAEITAKHSMTVLPPLPPLVITTAMLWSLMPTSTLISTIRLLRKTAFNEFASMPPSAAAATAMITKLAGGSHSSIPHISLHNGPASFIKPM